MTKNPPQSRIRLFVNALTLSRVPVTIAFNMAIFLKEGRLFVCSALFLFLFLSDYMDGKLARRYRVESRPGAVLDVATDFFFILSANYYLYQRGLLPFGILAVTLIKFSEFLFTSYLSNRKARRERVFLFDPIGRFVSIVLYAMPIQTLLLESLIDRTVFDQIMVLTVVLMSALSLVSIYQRSRQLIR
ncbi:MAG: CDP-alcohol phosphatidyltransferase family protein [Bacillota bacterium]|nr:CDP-alcohol phosphatidyltransferase family protein [Bacillota bacterium]